jgi:hypothetical protein
MVACPAPDKRPDYPDGHLLTSGRSSAARTATAPRDVKGRTPCIGASDRSRLTRGRGPRRKPGPRSIATAARCPQRCAVATLAILGVLGDRVHARAGRMRLSAGLTIAGLAMALLGPAPAVAICLVSRILDAVLADGIRLRGRRLALAWNLGMYVYVLLGGLAIRAPSGPRWSADRGTLTAGGLPRRRPGPHRARRCGHPAPPRAQPASARSGSSLAG